MSSLLEFLQKERKLNWKFWFKYYHQWLLGLIYNRNIKQDNSWKSVKIAKTIFPDNFPEDLKLSYEAGNKHNTNKLDGKIFKYLETQYSGIIMKRFKD